jgi:hypothetical protein
LSQGLGTPPSPWLFAYGVFITAENAAIRQKNRRIEEIDGKNKLLNLPKTKD